MNSKRMLLLILGLACLSVTTLLGPICGAQQAAVSITNVNVQLIDTRTAGNREIHVYNISAVLHNSGDAKSDEISVIFYDPEFNSTTTPPMKLLPLNATLMPGETKTFALSNWPTPLTGDVLINISFGPTSPTILPNSHNSGYYVYTLTIGQKKTTSTPGFETPFIFVAIALLLLGRKIK